ncbi:MAG TPA: SGNH/GDSL hydrolase family protein [Vicinamibacteria bacterium]
MRSLIVATLLALCGAPARAAEPPAPVTLGDEETVVFYGDSITEQNLYSAYLETFLAGRLPGKRIATFNFGWGGDTALGGTRRFGRDVAPVAPTLVFVNFGMNDGGYRPFQQRVYDAYLESQRALAAEIARAGARPVLFTTSPIDPDRRPDGDAYNGMLSRMADGVLAMGAELGAPVIDLFHPMLEVQRRAKQKSPGFTMIPDSVHPDPVGHLVMAYLAMRRIDAPRVVGEITVAGGKVTTSASASVSEVRARYDGAEFALELPFLPFYVPPAARPALELVPFEDEVNRFRLRADVGPVADRWVLSVDGVATATLTPADLAAGVDLALLDEAPWSVAARRLWEAAQYRWQKHFEAWRRMALSPPGTAMPELPTFAPFAAAQRAHADAMGRGLRALAAPGRYRVLLCPLGEAVPITAVALSPTYPFDAQFDRPHPPETGPRAVEWSDAPFEAGRIDLGARYAGASNVVAYARVDVEADADCALHLSMGSDDGLAVFLDGKRVFANDVRRGLRPGQDQVLVEVARGRHQLLFKVTQEGGDFGLAVEARVYGTAHVRTAPVR